MSTTTAVSTPWGTADFSSKLADGIILYGTPSHGGIKLSPDRQANMPRALRRRGGWYEEDCEYAFVYLAFPDEFTRQEVADAHETVRSWFPDEYEAWSGHKVTAAESFIVGRREFHAAHANDFIVTAAWGRGDDIPEGFVGVLAKRGGRDNRDGDEARFLVPDDEYTSGGHGFIVDPERHAPWTTAN